MGVFSRPLSEACNRSRVLDALPHHILKRMELDILWFLHIISPEKRAGFLSVSDYALARPGGRWLRNEFERDEVTRWSQLPHPTLVVRYVLDSLIARGYLLEEKFHQYQVSCSTEGVDFYFEHFMEQVEFGRSLKESRLARRS